MTTALDTRVARAGCRTFAKRRLILLFDINPAYAMLGGHRIVYVVLTFTYATTTTSEDERAIRHFLSMYSEDLICLVRGCCDKAGIS